MQHVLVRIHGLAVRGDGVMAMLQAQDHRIRFFSPEGDSLSSVGRRGKGPGEFDLVTEIGWAGDTLWVFDTLLRRFTLYAPDFSFVRTLNAPLHAYRRTRTATGEAERVRYPVDVEVLLADGSMLARPWLRSGGSDELVDPRWRALTRISPDGVITHVVSRIPRLDVESVGGATAFAPFRNNPAWDVSPDGSRIAVVYAALDGPDAGTIEVSMFTNRGDTVYHRRIPFEPIPIPEQVADSMAERWSAHAREAQAEGDYDSAEAIRRAKERMPRVYPPVESALVGRDARLWIRGRDTDRGVAYRVLDAGGREIDRVRLPRGATILAADSARIWVAEYDPYGVVSLLRYGVSGGPGRTT